MTRLAVLPATTSPLLGGGSVAVTHAETEDPYEQDDLDRDVERLIAQRRAREQRGET